MTSAKKKALQAAAAQVRALGVDLTNDYHAEVRISTAVEIADIARAYGYRKPRHANGSLARCFFRYLQRCCA